MPTKVVVTNRKALRKKYGTKLSKIEAAIKSLISADKKRGLTTSVVDLSSAAEMKKIKGAAVTKASDPKQNKQAIDAVYRALHPDYLLILGSIDVIPHQDLKNPVYDGVNDLDQHAWGDIPYACETPYSTNAAKFIGPTRVVGRVPDLTNGKDPDYLVKLLRYAQTWKPNPPSAAKSYFAVSADVWKGSTKLSTQKLFGNSTQVKLSPFDGYKWTPAEIKPIPHFINCHGAPADMHFYGEGAGDYPIAHQAKYLSKKSTRGTVAAAECCYGADLYDPGLTSPKHPSICNTYLERGAHGFFGSSTIAYGPADSNGAADLICQYFLDRVVSGASLGRAALEARQEFVKNGDMTDGIDLKTIAQFNLLGDPSIHPFETAKAAVLSTGLSASELAVAAKVTDKLLHDGVRARRRKLFVDGLSLAARIPVAQRKATPAGMKERLRQVAQNAGIEKPKMITFTRTAKSAQAPAAAAKAAKVFGTAFAPPSLEKGTARRIHIMLGKTKPPAMAIKSKKAKPPKGISNFIAVVAEEEGGELKSIRTLHSK